MREGRGSGQATGRDGSPQARSAPLPLLPRRGPRLATRAAPAGPRRLRDHHSSGAERSERRGRDLARARRPAFGSKGSAAARRRDGLPLRAAPPRPPRREDRLRGGADHRPHPHRRTGSCLAARGRHDRRLSGRHEGTGPRRADRARAPEVDETTMRFSLFFEMQLSGPTRATEAQVFRDCVEQAVLAEALGYHCIWEVEHHGLLEYSHSSAPEVFLAFVAARTKRIRLGHGVTLLPHRYNHPIRIAERIATLDILSGGRVNWGTGKSSSQVEQQAFETDPEELHAQWLEALEMIPRMWSSDVFQHRGRFFHVPPTQIVPKPVQEPHPPIFAACSRPDTAALVGTLGLGALNFAFGADDYLTDKVREYRAAVAKAKPAGRTKNDWFACTPATLVLKDDEKALRHGTRGARFFINALGRYYFGGDRPIGPLDIPRDDLTSEELREARETRNSAVSHLPTIVGDPASARETVSRFKDVGVDELMLVMQMGTIPHELICESIRTFAEEGMPHFG